jgi:hypothetical protein
MVTISSGRVAEINDPEVAMGPEEMVGRRDELEHVAHPRFFRESPQRAANVGESSSSGIGAGTRQRWRASRFRHAGRVDIDSSFGFVSGIKSDFPLESLQELLTVGRLATRELRVALGNCDLEIQKSVGSPDAVTNEFVGRVPGPSAHPLIDLRFEL